MYRDVFVAHYVLNMRLHNFYRNAGFSLNGKKLCHDGWVPPLLSASAPYNPNAMQRHRYQQSFMASLQRRLAFASQELRFSHIISR